ncbi:hypothetical protein [Escherichia coli]|uniref:hypothetical protein n=1 Tax=Escherichia coli TaxID=562 RepID=UPI003BF6FED0
MPNPGILCLFRNSAGEIKLNYDHNSPAAVASGEAEVAGMAGCDQIIHKKKKLSNNFHGMRNGSQAEAQKKKKKKVAWHGISTHHCS